MILLHEEKVLFAPDFPTGFRDLGFMNIGLTRKDQGEEGIE